MGRYQGHVLGLWNKVSAYTDDLLFYLSTPQTSLIALMQEVDRYGHLSNFNINFEKSILRPSHVPQEMARMLRRVYPFVWKKDSLFYLGVHITSDQIMLYDLNYASLMAGIRVDLKEMDRTISNMVWKSERY